MVKKREKGKNLLVLGNVCEIFEEIRAQIFKTEHTLLSQALPRGGFTNPSISGRIWQTKVRKSGTV